MATDADLALRLGGLAARVALPLAGTVVRTWTKADGSLATEVDVSIEQAMVRTLRRERPGDAILGEETGQADGQPTSKSGRRWLLDPIDGTSAFMSAHRDWGSHVALTEDGEVTVAVMTRPTEGRCWWATAGSGTFVGRLADPAGTARALRVSGTTDLQDARIGGLIDLGGVLQTRLAGRATWVTDEVSIVAALLDGRVDAVIDMGGDPWDLAPPALLVPEAGGRFQDPHGGTRLDLRWALYSNAALHNEIAAWLLPHCADGRREWSCGQS